MDLERLLAGNEGKRLEFKRDLSSPGPAIKTLVAFANTAGGVLVIGVEDRTRRVVGVDHPLDTEEGLMSLVADRISPRLIPEVEVVPGDLHPSSSSRPTSAQTDRTTCCPKGRRTEPMSGSARRTDGPIHL